MPNVVVIAGPNGAGKSTVAPVLLSDTLGVDELINADLIAKGLSYFRPESVAIQSGRIMLNRIRYLRSKKANFAFETTLAARTFAKWIRELKQNGYSFHMVFLWLQSPAVALGRVEIRVKTGGHHVDDETVMRRYHAGISNFFNLYEPLADSWYFYDNSSPKEPNLVAFKNSAGKMQVEDDNIWQPIVERYKK
jgi:predicted ABC-type ATPase